MSKFSIDISLQIRHPELSAELLKKEISLRPATVHSVGDKVIRGDGKELPFSYNETYLCYDILPLQDFYDVFEALKSANDFVKNKVKNNSVFFDINQSGGSTSYYMAVYTKEHVAFSIPSEILRETSELGIGVGIEIFQNYID